ncbi:hypothetical protein [Streptomyces zingiberis]|uniref:MmcQ/YjbR family DNA-binding protein n=1 Tax=Streptomyces zingiberis TaxID=2053010 RepID=A0ABX1C1B3_9ACTN|nr:hypothetical protein [Streptomyces zingiberis]NJQ02358.1 hypothetical protein [Streptomyces zingiberis]
MDRRELVRTLREERVPDAFYDIPGVHDIPFQSDAYFFLRPAPEGWAVGLRQRSEDQDVRLFPAEDAACRDLLGRLTTLPSPPPDGTSRAEEVLADADEIQRRAREDVERELRRRGPGTE